MPKVERIPQQETVRSTGTAEKGQEMMSIKISKQKEEIMLLYAYF
jgi:hypothetical protein